MTTLTKQKIGENKSVHNPFTIDRRTFVGIGAAVGALLAYGYRDGIQKYIQKFTGSEKDAYIPNSLNPADYMEVRPDGTVNLGKLYASTIKNGWNYVDIFPETEANDRIIGNNEGIFGFQLPEYYMGVISDGHDTKLLSVITDPGSMLKYNNKPAASPTPQMRPGVAELRMAELPGPQVISGD